MPIFFFNFGIVDISEANIIHIVSRFLIEILTRKYLTLPRMSVLQFYQLKVGEFVYSYLTVL